MQAGIEFQTSQILKLEGTLAKGFGVYPGDRKDQPLVDEEWEGS